MSRMTTYAWILPLALAAAVAVGAAARTRRPDPPRACSVLVIGPNEAMGARLKAKQAITSDVMAGRRTLLDAATAFQALDPDGYPYPEARSAQYGPDCSEEEAYCHMVIAWVRVGAPEGKRNELSDPLEAELAARLRDGTLRLPQGGASPHSTLYVHDAGRPSR